MSLVLIQPPAEEPIPLAEVKRDLRVEADFSEHDSVMEGYLLAGRQFAEKICNRAFMRQTWQLSLNRFMGSGIRLPLSPLISVDTVGYHDTAGSFQTVPVRNWQIETTEPPCLLPSFGNTWPVARDAIGSVRITFTVGYGGRSAVPAAIKAAILMFCKAHYEATFADVAGREYERRMAAVDTLLSPYRVLRFA